MNLTLEINADDLIVDLVSPTVEKGVSMATVVAIVMLRTQGGKLKLK